MTYNLYLYVTCNDGDIIFTKKVNDLIIVPDMDVEYNLTEYTKIERVVFSTHDDQYYIHLKRIYEPQLSKKDSVRGFFFRWKEYK